MRFVLGEIEVKGTIGSGFKHVMLGLKFGPPRPNIEKPDSPPTLRRGYEMPSSELFPADLYVELIASQKIKLEDAVVDGFYAKDEKAQSEVIRRASQLEELFTSALDYAAGILGLRLHHTLVALPIHDQCFAYRGKGDLYACSVMFELTVPDEFKLKVGDKDGKATRRALPPLVKGRDWKEAADILAWLLRAWCAKDSVLKFVSLFASLECVVPARLEDRSVVWEKERKAILGLVKKHGRDLDQKNLVKFAIGLKMPSPSISERFEGWATKEALKGWKNDIVAFKKFIRMRNLLLHAGKSGVEFRVSIGESDMRSLADIAERYVSLALFGDADVYQSASRPINKNPESQIRITVNAFKEGDG